MDVIPAALTLALTQFSQLDQLDVCWQAGFHVKLDPPGRAMTRQASIIIIMMYCEYFFNEIQ